MCHQASYYWGQLECDPWGGHSDVPARIHLHGRTCYPAAETVVSRWPPAVSSFGVCPRDRELPRSKSCPFQGSLHLLTEQGKAIKVGIATWLRTFWRTVHSFPLGLAKPLSELILQLHFSFPFRRVDSLISNSYLKLHIICSQGT